MSNKPCIRCARRLPLSEFYAHPQMNDGHLNKCKDCCREYANYRWRELQGDGAWLEKERARARDKYHRLYAPTDPMPFYVAPVSQEVKDRARALFANAVRSGKLKRPANCERCHQAKPRIAGHHEDYTKPLDVMWLCPKCHRARHAEMAREAA